MGILANENAISSGGYQISNSLRFQQASSQYGSRTFSAGNQKTWTWSAWVKCGYVGTEQFLFGRSTTNLDTGYTNIQFNGGFLEFSNWSGAMNVRTTQVFRDPGAWYHIMVVLDTTQATASNRVKFYINGSQVTAFNIANYPTLNQDLVINAAAQHLLGARTGSSLYFDGYMTEVNFIDGQALTPSSFGETNALTGQWVAKKYTGTYGTNGFYLPFSNGTSTTTLGADSSGNSNNWTLNNFTRSAGVSDCWMIDVPSGNGGAAGTQPNSNYCVLNPLDKNSSISMTEANLKAVSTSGAASWTSARSSMYVSSGKWYWEVYITYSSANGFITGIADSNFNPLTQRAGDTSGSYVMASDGNKGNNGSFVSYYSPSLPSGTWIGVALDLDAGTLTFYRNNTSLGTAYSGISGTFAPVTSIYGTGGLNSYFNFGQRSFNYTPPSGFKALCTANLPAATIKKGNQYMDATLYTGNGSTQSIVNAAGFAPDLVWIKTRSNTYSHNIEDTVRGTSKNLQSDSTAAEGTGNNGAVTAFNSNGFTIAAGASSILEVGANGATYVAWQWDAGSSTVTNTNGTISSQVRANPTAGVSVVTYTGNGVSSATVGHGLGVAPKMVIHKARSTTSNWNSNHVGIPNSFISLNTTDAAASGGGTNGAIGYQSTNTATTFQFTAGSSSVNNVNANGSTYVAYCFSEIAGFSKFGSYTGNGSADGPFVYCGFRPKYVMVKNSSAAGYDWVIWDSARDTYNVASNILVANQSSAEASSTSFYFDFLSNGFKVRAAYAGVNGSTNTLIYMAFAENPFAQANAR